LIDETKWIYQKLYPSKKHSNEKTLETKILKVLEFIRIHHMEVMYLYFYKKQEIFPEITLEDLWTIYDLDQEYLSFSLQKYKQTFNYKYIHLSVERGQTLL
jgi:hypothetical protein